MEADYNFVLRIIWGRRLVKKARDKNLFMSAQQAQPGRLAVRGILNKVISFDLLRQLKKNGASGDADGVGCYDRIIPPEAMVCCRRWGLPKSAAEMITIILNNTVYKLRTGHGISARAYMSDALRRILGVGQGSCAPPAIWMAVLDPHPVLISREISGL